MIVLITIAEFCGAVILASNNHAQAKAVLHKLSAHQTPLLDAMLNGNRAVYDYESAWILRNAREYSNLHSLELRHQNELVLQLAMDDHSLPWLINTVVHTPDPTRKAQWVMRFQALHSGDYILLIRIGLIGIISWIAIALIMALASTAPRPVAKIEPRSMAELDVTTAPPATSSDTFGLDNSPESPAFPSPSHSDKKIEQDFLYRLEREIARSAEHALDLSICLLRSETIRSESGKAHTILLNEFTHDDLIFKVDNRTYAVILPHNDLDQAMARVELFLRKTLAKPEEANIFQSATAGLSSRSGRLVESRRVYREAGIALRKAEPNAGRIAGFRADPGRYRNYLTHHKI
jgi:hypothetical protein